jgi:hypothetical protein
VKRYDDDNDNNSNNNNPSPSKHSNRVSLNTGHANNYSVFNEVLFSKGTELSSLNTAAFWLNFTSNSTAAHAT